MFLLWQRQNPCNGRTEYRLHLHNTPPIHKDGVDDLDGVILYFLDWLDLPGVLAMTSRRNHQLLLKLLLLAGTILEKSWGWCLRR
jgi:hypothetical protein